MRNGIAYWGRNPSRAAMDADRMRRAGFHWVNVPISEERMRFDRQATQEIIAILKHCDLEVRISPWGVGGLFGGEGVRSHLEPMHALEQWLNDADALHADAMYWDEPHGTQGAAAVERFAGVLETPQYTYWNPRVGISPNDATLDRMTGLGIDVYDRDAERAADWAARLFVEHRRPVHVWVRAFRRSYGESEWPADDIRALRALGVDEIAVWGYPFSAGTSILDCADPAGMWEHLCSALLILEPIKSGAGSALVG